MKSIEERIEAIEKRLSEIDTMLESLEHARAKTITNWLDGPIMMYGKYAINDNEIEDIVKKAE